MLSFNACAIHKNKIYSITNAEGFPITVDMEAKRISYLNDISNEEYLTIPGGLGVAFNVEDEIYFFGLDGNTVVIYNTAANSCERRSINCHAQDWGNYAAITIKEDDIVIFSSYEAKIVKINTKTHDVIFEGRIDSGSHKGTEEKCFSCGCRVQDTMWLFGDNGTAVAYDLVSGMYKEQILPMQMDECADVVYREDSFYLLDISGQVVRWNPQDNRTKVLVDKQNSELPFWRVLAADKMLWLLPALGQEIYKIDYETDAVTRYQSYPEDFEYTGPAEWGKYYGSCEDENRYYLAMRTANYMLAIDKKTGKEQWLKFELPTEKEYIFQFVKRKMIINESSCTLQNYLAGI